LEVQLRAEVEALLRKAEEAGNAEPVVGMKVAEEVRLRHERLARVGEAKEELERRAQARYELEKAAYEERQAQRLEREQQRGRKLGGRAPKPPKPGPRGSDQINFTDPGVAQSCRKASAASSSPTMPKRAWSMAVA
jgi:hypothetical protein